MCVCVCVSVYVYQCMCISVSVYQCINVCVCVCEKSVHINGCFAGLCAAVNTSYLVIKETVDVIKGGRELGHVRAALLGRAEARLDLLGGVVQLDADVGAPALGVAVETHCLRTQTLSSKKSL